jgi:hypothetical protein
MSLEPHFKHLDISQAQGVKRKTENNEKKNQVPANVG